MRHGFLLIDKPSGPTSHDIVGTVRRVLSEKDIGHLGTLDPAATGLMVLAVGSKALKVIEFFNGLPKEYEADIRFGSVSTTYDGQGMIDPVPRKPGVNLPAIDDVKRAIQERFLGEVEQVPPAHSAIHIDGQRAYELARKGKLVEMPARKVEITACEIVSFTYPDLKLRVACSSGTYIRSLAHDMGHLLKCGAYLSGLRRTRVGKWSVADAVKPNEAKWTDVMPLKEVLAHFPKLEITDKEFDDLSHGRRIPYIVEPGTIAWYLDLPVAVLVPSPKNKEEAQPRKVL